MRRFVRTIAFLGVGGALSVVASGCTGGETVESAEAPAGQTQPARTARDPTEATAGLGSLTTSCRTDESRLTALAERASAFELLHSVTESADEILAHVRTTASGAHPDCVRLIKEYALRRSGCHPGIRTYPWMHCDFEEQSPLLDREQAED